MYLWAIGVSWERNMYVRVMDDRRSKLPACASYLCLLSLFLLNPNVWFHPIMNFLWAHPTLGIFGSFRHQVMMERSGWMITWISRLTHIFWEMFFFFFFWIECNSPLQVAKSCTRTLGVYVVILSSEFTVNLHVASFPITDTCNSTESAGSYAASGRTTCVLGLLERSYFMFSSLVTTGSLCCHPVNGSMKYSQVWYILSLESKMMWSLCLLILLDCSTMPQTIVFLKISLMWLAPTSS